MTKPSVLIVGAGLSGLCLAAAFEVFCPELLNYDLIDKQTSPHFPECGLSLAANAVAAVEQLGRAQPLLQQGYAAQAVSFCDDKNQLLSLKSTQDLHPKGFPLLGLSMAKLYAALLTPSIKAKLQSGVALDSLEKQQDKIIAILSNGEQKAYDLVIGADGIRSSVRKFAHLGNEEIPLSLGITGWQLLVKRSPTLSHPTTVLGAGKLFSLFPISDTQAYAMAALLTPPKDVSEEERNSVKFMKSHFESLGKEVSFAVEQIDPLSTLAVGHRLQTVREVKTHSKLMSTVLLIGDASHACAPTFGQDIAMCIEDAVIVAKLLAAFKALPIDQVIQFYDLFRFKTIREVQTISNFILQRQVQAIDSQAIAVRNHKIETEGPFTISFWQEYLKTDIFDDLNHFIHTRLN